MPRLFWKSKIISRMHFSSGMPNFDAAAQGFRLFFFFFTNRRRTKIIRDYKITDASVHDSNVFEEILDETNTSCDVYADSAYRSAEHEANLKEKKFRPHLQRKGCKGHQLTSWEKQGNRTRSRVRSMIEHVFGAIHQRAGNVILRTIGISMAEVKLGLRNIAYNMDRFCTLMLQNA